MKKIFKLSKENLDLAKCEILTVTKPKSFELYDDLLLVETDLDLSKRLGYSHSIYRFLFDCEVYDLQEKIDKFNWQEIYRDNFCVRIQGMKLTEKEIASLVFKKLDNPKIKLKESKTKIEFFQVKNKIVCGLFLSDIDKSYNERRAHLRPELHPTSMHPKLSRACINLTGLTSGTILDPFVGSGGILIEAGIMDFKVMGYDIDSEQIIRARKNLEHYKIKDSIIVVHDSTKLSKKVDAMVTDLPYGRGSKGKDLENLYPNFLKSAESVTDNMVVIFPDFIIYKNIIKQTNWKIKHKFEIYVHKSLTRIVLKLIK